jgi:ribosomal protein S3AE
MAIAKKKKRFFEVEMPLIKKETQLLAFKPEELQGRIIKYDLTRMLKGKNSLLDLDVYMKEDKLTSTPRKLTLLPTYIRRMIRKNTDPVETSFKLECKDAELTIKPFLVTRRKVSRKVKQALRENIEKEIKEDCKNKKYEYIFDDIIKNKLQKEMSLKLKRVYPLSLCEIRMIIVDSKKEEKQESNSKE